MTSPTFFDKNKQQNAQDDFSTTKLNIPGAMFSMSCQIIASQKAAALQKTSSAIQNSSALKI